MTNYERNEERRAIPIAQCFLGILALLVSFSSEAQTIIRVNGGAACIPVPSGVVSSKYCSGDDGTAAIPLTWATVGPFTNVVEGTTPSYNLRSYLTEPGSPNATLSLVGSVTNWSLSTDTLSYDGSGISAGTLIVRATRNADVSDSLPFAVSSVAAASTDTKAPTIPTGVTVALDGSNDPVLTFDASSDVRVSGEEASGLSTFTVYRNGVALTPTAYTGTGLNAPTYTGADVGDLVPDGTSTQTVSNWALTAEGVTDTTHDEFHLVSTEITGDATCTAKIVSADEVSGVRASLIARETNGTLARYISARVLPPTYTVRGHYRVVTDAGTPVSSGSAIHTGFPIWLQLQRSGDDWTVRSSTDGNTWGGVLAFNLGLNQTLKWGLALFSGVNSSVANASFEQLNCTARPRQTFTDTGATGGTTPIYTIKAKDVTGNESAASVAVSIAVPADPDPPPGNSDTPDYVDPVDGVTIGTRTTVPVANNAALAGALAAANCSEILSLNGGTYATSQTYAKNCNADAAITITCDAGETCTMTGSWSLTGTRGILTGLLFSGTGAKITCGGTNNKIIGNEFTGWSSGNAVTPTGNQCEVAYNEFHDHAAYTGNETGGAAGQRIGIRASPNSRDGWFHHNYFHDFSDKPDPQDYNSGQNDAIELCNTGADGGIDSGHYVEYNLVEDHLQGQQIGSGTIDWKCGGGVMRYNTFRRVAGRMDVRAATVQMIVEGNYLTESGGMQLRGNSHIVVGNYLRGGGTVVTNSGGAGLLSAMAGQHLCTNAANNTRPVVCNARFEGNDVVTLRIGESNSNADNIPVTNTIVRDHAGAITCGLFNNGNAAQTGTDGACGDAANPTALYEFVFATPLTSADVGPDAISSASAAYRAARGL